MKFSLVLGNLYVLFLSNFWQYMLHHNYNNFCYAIYPNNPLIGSLNVRNLRRQLWMTLKPPRQMTGAAAKGWKNVNKNILRARIRALPWTLPTTTWQFRVLPSLLRLLKYYKQWDQSIYEVYLNLCTALISRFFYSNLQSWGDWKDSWNIVSWSKM